MRMVNIGSNDEVGEGWGWLSPRPLFLPVVLLAEMFLRVFSFLKKKGIFGF